MLWVWKSYYNRGTLTPRHCDRWFTVSDDLFSLIVVRLSYLSLLWTSRLRDVVTRACACCPDPFLLSGRGVDCSCAFRGTRLPCPPPGPWSGLWHSPGRVRPLELHSCIPTFRRIAVKILHVRVESTSQRMEALNHTQVRISFSRAVLC